MFDLAGDLTALLARYECFPFRIDFERGGILFVPMSRETFRRSSFLDQRAILAGPGTRFVAYEELSGRASPDRAAHSAHFVLHGAFCGSTLLARHFEELPHCLVLKEPQVLAQVARLENSRPVGPMGPPPGADWLDAALTLLSRTAPDDAAVLIKAPDQFNCLARRVLDRDPTTKIIFLCAPLRVFLLSTLKSEERRAWLRSRGRGLRSQLARVPLREALAVEELTDGQLAAAIWLLNSYICSELLARIDAHRILAMNSEELIGHPEQAFPQAVEFLGLARDQDIRNALAAFRPIHYYSKNPDLPDRFDAATRDEVFAEIDRRCGSEADAAILWARRMSSDWISRSPFPVG